VTALADLLREVRACQLCAAHLPLGPRPVVHVSATARLLIASQAPGTKVHQQGISFWDASGDRLRDWLGMEKSVFYDEAQVAILPMGFCYPGRLEAGGDAPPRRECAPQWRDKLLAAMPALRLTLLPRYFPLPHPSGRTGVWERRNPWFVTDVLPALRQAVDGAFAR
jgi:uracil-DNA glycosylase